MARAAEDYVWSSCARTGAGRHRAPVDRARLRWFLADALSELPEHLRAERTKAPPERGLREVGAAGFEPATSRV